MSAPRRSLGRRAALAAGSLLAAIPLLDVSAANAAPASAFAPASLTAPADAALDWLEGELTADGGHLTTSYEYESEIYSFDDWGLTIDAILALAADGRGSEPAAATATDQVEASIGDYVTGGDFGPDDRYAAALGKALLMASIQGSDPTSFGGFDLVSELLARMQADGADAGRFSDLTSWGDDYSNGLGQALAIMGLARTAAGAPDEAIEFLLDQQCPSGGFRGDYTTSGGCTSDASSTTDATAFAIQALAAVDLDCAVRGAVSDAITWLLDNQAGDGSFGGESGANTNSSGLAAQALRAVGSDASADSAAGFVTGLQLTSGDDSGAIALNQAGYDSAADGIATLERDGFRRATGQAVLALDLPAYSEIGAEPIDPAALAPCAPVPTTAPPSAPTATASATSVVLGGSTTVSGSGFTPGEQVTITLHSTPVLLATVVADGEGRVTKAVTIPTDLEVGEHRIELVGLTSGVRASIEIEVLGTEVAGRGTLPATGRASAASVALAVALLLAGATLIGAARRRAAAI
ncbi:MAG: prenyltransferase/squalene oxidase repeat-containing protein [Actinomycetota bacterium]